MLKNKLKIVESIFAYSTENTYETYKRVLLPLKTAIINGEIRPKSVKYKDGFTEEYYPYVKEKNWGTNLDIFELKLNKVLDCELKVFRCDRYSTITGKDHRLAGTYVDEPKEATIISEPYKEVVESVVRGKKEYEFINVEYEGDTIRVLYHENAVDANLNERINKNSRRWWYGNGYYI